MRILVIEDEIGLSDAICHVLKNENYQVDASYNGIDGLNNALSGIYDAVILDIMLPRLNGFEVLKELRKENKTTPVVILTAKSDVDSKVKGLDIGADYYLTKPFETEELLACIRAVTRRKGVIENNDTLEFDDLVLSTKQSEISCKSTGTSIKLGVKELAILEIMMKNQNQIISKESMIEKVWGYDNDSEYNNIEVYISFIRKKVAFTGSHVRIKASRGLGYSLEKGE